MTITPISIDTDYPKIKQQIKFRIQYNTKGRCVWIHETAGAALLVYMNRELHNRAESSILGKHIIKQRLERVETWLT